MQLIQPISTVTRFLQQSFPQTPLRGLSRLGDIFQKRFPPYTAVVPMNAGFQMKLQSKNPAEMYLLLAGVYQPALTHLLSQYAVQNGYYLDVGANLGFFTLLFAQWAGTEGRVASFEVNPTMVARIQEGVRLNQFQVQIVEQAIHNYPDETVSFYISASPGKSSLYENQVSDIVQQIQVQTITIDDFVQASKWTRVDMIKMDIEGNDCNGLLGGANTIRSYHPFIVFEYWRDTAQHLQEQVADLLADCQYRLEMLSLQGQRQPFAWTVPDNLHHVDVLCIPNRKDGL